MRIAVVGATGRIGSELCRKLLGEGHEVLALSRGGPGLEALTKLGAKPYVGSFDTGVGDLDNFFQEADAAFLMVKTDWKNLHTHYPTVARRFVDALKNTPVKLAVSLTAIGSDINGDTGHFKSFYHLDQTLNELESLDLVHLRAGWFMENLHQWTQAIIKHGCIGWSLHPDVRIPWIATRDIAMMAAEELTGPSGNRRTIKEVGSEDLTMPEVAAIISREIGKPVEYRFVDRKQDHIKAEYLDKFGTLEQWDDDSQTLDALNNGVVKFHRHRGPLPTKMTTFVKEIWKPMYLEALAKERVDESFLTWISSPSCMKT